VFGGGQITQQLHAATACFALWLGLVRRLAGLPAEAGGQVAGAMQQPRGAVLCAVLCRVLCRLDEYAKRGSEPDSELQIYTWPDATLRELTELIKDVRKDACNRWEQQGAGGG
jgi:hypothetical protein